MYQQGQPLPVNAQQPDYRFFFQNPQPNNLPYQPRVNTIPQLANMVPLVMACLINAIQTNATKNPIRTFTYNWYSRNGYQNPEFDRLMQDAMNYFELLVIDGQSNGQRVDPGQMGLKAGGEYAAIGTAISLQMFEGLRPYSNPEMINELNGWLNTHNNVVQAWQAMRQRMQANQPMHGGGYPAPGSGYPAPGMVAGGMTPYDQAMARRSGGGEVPGINPSLYTSNQPTPMMDGPSTPGVATSGLKPRPAVTQVEELSFDATEYDNASRTFVTAPRRNPNAPNLPHNDTVQIHADAAPAPAPAPAPVSAPEIEEPIMQVLPDGSTLHLAAVTDMIPTTKCRLVYDPAKHIPWYRATTRGDVSVVLTDKETDVNYQDHEQDPNLRQQHREIKPGLKSGITAEGQANLERTERELAELRERQAEEERQRQEVMAAKDAEEAAAESGPDIEMPSTTEGLVMVHSIHEAELLATLKHFPAAVEGESDGSFSRQFFFREVRPYVCQDHQLEKFEGFENDDSYDRLVVELPSLMEGKHAKFWQEMDRRLTDRFNAALAAEFSCDGWHIDSFCEDYVSLIELMSKSFSEDFIEQIQESARYIMAQVFQALSTDDTNAYLEMVSTMGVEVDQDTANALLVLSKLTSLTYLPIAKADIADFLATGILASKASVFHRVLKALIERTKPLEVQYGTLSRHLLKLTSGEYFEVYESRMVDDVFVLREVQL